MPRYPSLRDQLEQSIAETATVIPFRRIPEATADPVGLPMMRAPGSGDADHAIDAKARAVVERADFPPEGDAS